MKRKTNILLILLFFSSIIFFTDGVTLGFLYHTEPILNNPLIKSNGIQYESHAAIFIMNNQNFTATASNEGWSGNGSRTNPYVISNLNISSATKIYLIEIRDTDCFFNIQNCFLNGYDKTLAGIYFQNVTNGKLSNSMIITNSNSQGIFLRNSHNNTIQNNSFQNCNRGILTEYSDFNNLISNTITNTIKAIHLFYSYNSTLSNNSIHTNTDGIYIFRSDNSSVIANNCSYNTNNGITIYNSTGNTIKSNLAHYNLNNGIYSFRSYLTNLISDNEILHTSYCGILSEESGGITISRNAIHSNRKSGIYCLETEFSNIDSNILENNGEIGMSGIDLLRSSNNSIYANIATNNTKSGITLWEDSYSNSIENNSLFSSEFGISIHLNSNKNLILENSIFHNDDSGIIVSSSSKNEVINNTIAYNGLFAISLENSGNNLVKFNNFIRNNVNHDLSQANDINYQNIANNFANNYWDEWLTPDNDSNGIIDTPYPINGSSNNQDLSPLKIPISSPCPYEFLGRLTLTQPIDSTSISGTTTIQWLIATNKLANPISFDIYYSTSLSNWESIVSDLSINQYNWDTTGLQNGTYYLKIIATSGAITVESQIIKLSIENMESESIKTTDSSTDTVSFSRFPSLFVLLLIFIVIVRKRS